MLTLIDPDPDLRGRFEAGTLTDGDRQQHPVLERWTRARQLKRAPRPQPLDLPPQCRKDRTASLVVRANELLDTAFNELGRRGFGIFLADCEGVVLISRGIERFSDPNIRASLGQGASATEAALGTNAIGTALAEQRSVAVIGGAHYDQMLRQLCCYAVPIRNGRGNTVAVLDLSGPAEGADPLLGVVAQSLAVTIESALVQVAVDELRSREDLERERELWAGMIGHDLRNPLMAVQLAAELLVREGEPLATRMGSRIASSSLRMQRMVDELIEQAREQARALDRRAINVLDLCNEVVDELRMVHPTRTLAVECVGDPRAELDGDRITRLIQNLVGNAITHGRPDTPVRISVIGHADSLTLEVVNQGPPIPASSQPFLPFRRGTDRGDGLGLGLHIVRSIVLMHGGDISYESDERLTRFRVWLPRTR